MRNLPNAASGARFVPSGSTNGVMRRSTSKPFRSTTSKCLCLRVPLCLRSLRSSRAASARAPPPAEHAASEAFAGAEGSAARGPGASFGIVNPPPFCGGGAAGGAPPPAASPLASRGIARRPIECRRRRDSRGTKKKSVPKKTVFADARRSSATRVERTAEHLNAKKKPSAAPHNQLEF